MFWTTNIHLIQVNDVIPELQGRQIIFKNVQGY